MSLELLCLSVWEGEQTSQKRRAISHQSAAGTIQEGWSGPESWIGGSSYRPSG